MEQPHQFNWNDLSTRLSPKAALIFPNDAATFENATARWSTFQNPNISVVVEVSTESDVSETVKYANQNNIPFLAKVGGHGTTESLGNVHQGIEIWLRNLNTVTVNGDTATIGGGATNKNVTDALWAKTKQTTTGVCECIGIVSPLLGGGHGFLQGHYGMVSDNLVSARLVTADGSVMTVSNKSNPDLFWSLKGAGHNFGIVTQVEQKIYDVPASDDWAFQNLIFTLDKAEKLFEEANNLPLDQEIGLHGVFITMLNPEVDPKNPIILLLLINSGGPSSVEQFAAPFVALGPVMQQAGTMSYPDLPALTGGRISDPNCQPGSSLQLFPVGAKKFNPPVIASALQRFGQIIDQNPVFNTSVVMFEGYPLKGVRAIPADSSAFPQRFDDYLIGLIMNYSEDPSQGAKATELGIELRNMLFNGSGNTNLHSYVNYAQGSEGPLAWYGHEDWRQERLKTVKQELDPQGKFDFYNPIP